MTKITIQSQRMTPDLCREWIETKVFPLQPENYQNQYPEFPGSVGLEIEMLPLFSDEHSTTPSRVPLQGQKNSLAAWLRKIALTHGWQAIESDQDSNPTLMAIKLDQGDNLSFEPGGQLEFSSRPYHCLSEAICRTKYIQSLLDRELMELGQVSILQVGINPWHSIDDIGLQMQKPRYLAMDEFFKRISSYGPRMMRQTCTVQVNLDFGRDEITMAKRFLGSQLIAPISGAIFNYSAYESGTFCGVTGLRQRVWRHLDPTRTDIPPLDQLLKSMNKKACVDTWFDFMMKARVVFVTGQNYRVIHDHVTWEDWMKAGINGQFPTQNDFETHLSLLFPEVRARGFIEMRSVDCQSRVWQFAPAGWWTGLLYNNQALDEVIELMTPYVDKLNQLLLKSENGLKDPLMHSLAKKLATISMNGLRRLPSCYYAGGALKSLQGFSEQFIERGRVPADDIIDEVNRSGRLDLKTFKSVEHRWQELKEKMTDPAQLL